MTTNFDSVQEQAVKTALENPNYRWRTVEGVANETGLSAETVEAVNPEKSGDCFQIVYSF